MNKDLTEIVFILDRSGSMRGLENDTIGGFNSLIEKQKKLPGEANVTTILFDHAYMLLHDRVRLTELNPMTNEEYFVRGSTALLDAIGRTISRMIHVAKTTNEHEKAKNVIFVITTDGMENASVEYSHSKIRSMIEYQQEQYNWEFIFLGANMDAIATAEQFGIRKDKAASYRADHHGVSINYESMNEAIHQKRTKDCVTENWKERIEKEYEKRK